MIGNERVSSLLQAFKDQRILVVGDLMLDRHTYGTVERISPEAPVPVVQVHEDKNVPGGASNVAWNIQALGGQAALSGILGMDTSGSILKELLERNGVCVEGVLESRGVPTTVKMRVIAERQQVVRVDWDHLAQLDAKTYEAFMSMLKREVTRATGVIVEDYGKGVVRQEVVDVVIRVAQDKGIPTGFDPKKNYSLDLEGVTIATPNRHEAFQAVGVTEDLGPPNPLEDLSLLRVGEKLLQQWGPNKLMITLGPQGMLLMQEGRDPLHVPTRAREVFDVSGAGDTVIAACMLALAAGASFEEAAELANIAAGVVVGKVGTATCSSEELLARVSSSLTAV